jgi:hypothetical protein
MRTPMALEVATDEGLIKQVSQKLKEKRCRDCREGMFGTQGNSSQNQRAGSKSGIEIHVWLEAEKKERQLWKVESRTAERREARDERKGPRILRFHGDLIHGAMEFSCEK